MPDTSPPSRGRRWLFMPFGLLGLLVAGWAAMWFVMSDQTSRALDTFMANESALGRLWTCPNRAVGGFPFRIEVACESLSLQRPDGRLTLGSVRSVAQVYDPRHIITHIAGPVRASDGHIGIEGNWRLLQASLRISGEGLQRVSLVVDQPEFRVTGVPLGDLNLSGQRLETHLRPNPTRAANEGAYDWTLQGSKLVVPGLDDLIGGAEAAELDLQLTATQARDLTARAVPEEFERWRAAGGLIEITSLTLVKGQRRIEGKGQIGLDDAHRPQGRAELAAVGLEGLVGRFTGARAGATAALLGALLGKRDNTRPPPTIDLSAKPELTPLPPLRLEGGRVFLGPLPIPGVRIAPLY